MVIDDIKNFLTVVQTQNVTRASQLIGLSQPALSYSIKRLEKEVGGELFIRFKNGLKLTKLGESFESNARKLIFNWQELQKSADPKSTDFSGTYSIAVHPSVALYTLENFLGAVTKNYPKLNIDLIHGLSRGMTEKVINWEADFGIVVNPLRHPDLVIKNLCQDHVEIYHVPKCKKTLIYNPELLQSQKIISKIKSNQLPIDSEIKSDSLEVVASLAELGLGYAILPGRIAKTHPKLKRLKDSPSFSDKICLIFRPDKHKNNALSRLFIDSMTEKIR